MNYKKILKICLNTILVMLAIFFIFIFNGIIEKSIVDNKMKNFKERAVFLGEHPVIEDVYLYTVEKKYDYEDLSRNTFNGSSYIGSKTDIILTNRTPRLGSADLERIVGFLSKNMFLGHSSINYTDDGSNMYEVVGNSSNPDLNVVLDSINDWHHLIGSENSPYIVGLRIKNTTEEQRDKMVEYAEAQVGKKYNYTFIFNKLNTYYCTDLVSRSAKHAGININYDYFATTGNDMIASKNTYIFFLKETVVVDGKTRHNVYYLKEN